MQSYLQCNVTSIATTLNHFYHYYQILRFTITSLSSKIFVSFTYSFKTYDHVFDSRATRIRGRSWISFNYNPDCDFNNNLAGVPSWVLLSYNGETSRAKFVRNLTQNSRRASNQSPFSCCCTAVTCRAYARYYASMWSPSVHRTFPRHCTRHVRPREAGLIKRAPSRRRRSMAPAYLNPAFIQRRY